MPHHYLPTFQHQDKNLAGSWEQVRKSPKESLPKVSLLEMLLYVLDHRKANEAARNFHIREATKSNDNAPVERKPRRGRSSLDSKRRDR